MRRERGKPVYEVTAGVIRKDGSILVAKRRKGAHLAGTWEFPGGKREEGESLSACLKRELLEELGILVTVGPRIDAVVHDYPEKRVVLHGFPLHLAQRGTQTPGVPGGSMDNPR